MKRWRRKKTQTTDATDDGAHAHGAAQEALDQAKAQRPAVKEVASTLRDLRRNNNFAESIAAAMRRRP